MSTSFAKKLKAKKVELPAPAPKMTAEEMRAEYQQAATGLVQRSKLIQRLAAENEQISNRLNILEAEIEKELASAKDNANTAQQNKP